MESFLVSDLFIAAFKFILKHHRRTSRWANLEVFSILYINRYQWPNIFFNTIFLQWVRCSNENCCYTRILRKKKYDTLSIKFKKKFLICFLKSNFCESYHLFCDIIFLGISPLVIIPIHKRAKPNLNFTSFQKYA